MAINYWWLPPNWRGAMAFEKESFETMVAALLKKEEEAAAETESAVNSAPAAASLVTAAQDADDVSVHTEL